VLESLTEEEFGRLKRELPSALINREEVVFVEPDPAYFAKLAAARGDSADRAFFAALKATYPEPVWPVYIEQQTDYSGCTRFGSMSLVDTFHAWAQFQRGCPDRYVAAAKHEVGLVVQIFEPVASQDKQRGSGGKRCVIGRDCDLVFC